MSDLRMHHDMTQRLHLHSRGHVESLARHLFKNDPVGLRVVDAEFAEHKIYNPGESTKHIDWKLFAKTDRLYTKRYEEETNLRCHLIIDNSSSMHYPQMKEFSISKLNKIAFSALASASLMHILKKQRDAVGMSIYSDGYDYYSPEKGSERHHQMLLSQLSKTAVSKPLNKQTETYTYLHQIAEKIHRRSLIFFFTDMFQT